jgi:hypothetical protein
VVGRYNATPSTAPDWSRDEEDKVFVVGGGNEWFARKNALEVKANGDVNALGTIKAAALVVPPSGGISMGIYEVP